MILLLVMLNVLVIIIIYRCLDFRLGRGNIITRNLTCTLLKNLNTLTIRLINEVSRPMSSLETENIDFCGHSQRKNKLSFRLKRSQHSFLDFEAKD